MQSHIRRAVAYIAAKAIGSSGAQSVYDYAQSGFYNFTGNVSPANVNVYDYDQSCYISGSQSGGVYKLYHNGNSSYIDLSVERATFTGYDYGSGTSYTGTVSGNSVSIYDYEHSQYFNYTV